MRKTLREQVQEIITKRYGGNSAKAARDMGLEHTTVWRFLHERERIIALRTFALMCDWAKIDPKDVIDEFTK